MGNQQAAAHSGPTVPLPQDAPQAEIERFLWLGAQGLLTPEDFARLLHHQGGPGRPPGAPLPKIFRVDVNVKKATLRAIPDTSSSSSSSSRRFFGVDFLFDARVPVIITVFFVASDVNAVPTVGAASSTLVPSSAAASPCFSPVYKAMFKPREFPTPGLGLRYSSLPMDSLDISMFTEDELFRYPSTRPASASKDSRTHGTDALSAGRSLTVPPRERERRPSDAASTASDVPLTADTDLPPTEAVPYQASSTPCQTYPVIIVAQARDVPPDERVTVQVTYAAFKRRGDGSIGLRPLKQKIFIGGVGYELKDIYGVEQAPATDDDHPSSPHPAPSAVPTDDSQLSGDCVVCLSNPRDTTILPCRHMCLCHECARELAQRSDKCPICRSFIADFIELRLPPRVPDAFSGAMTISAAARPPSSPANPARLPPATVDPPGLT